MKLRLVCEGLEINELVEIEKWFGGDLMLTRKVPRRFEFVSNWEKDDFRLKINKSYDGYLKGGKGYNNAYLIIEE